eukprot:TRINITY_DN1228_c0_g1_i6.p1 TRINITY_DN1228_c0_g1~~TRINITY_DN1228_c0_g1_i6.p1  ORF type:complete len:782 (-),score=205.52 TRINITY_DN1228_c0_g1_i6:538-2883(-)
MSSNVTFSGLASGLNTQALVTNVLRFNQQRITLLQQSVSTTTTKQTAFQGVQSRLQTLMSDASALAQPQGSIFDNKTISSSNTDLVTAAVGSGAKSGVTSIKVLALAQADQIASQGYEDPGSQISQGTIQIQAGSKSATLTIDGTNNTLTGLASSINNSNIGVTATIVNTGSTDARTQPYRMILTADNSGTANAIHITNNLAASASGATRPNFDTAEIGPAVTEAGFTGTSAVTSSGTYTGGSNDTFTFKVVTGGTVGTDNGIELSYSNSTGTQTGTITLNNTDTDTPKAVVDGVQVQFGAGTLTANEEFTVNTFTPSIQTAADAQVQLGAGSGAVVIRSATNTVTNLIPGVSLKLQSADPTKTVQLNVADDVDGAITKITNFVNDYNNFASYIDYQTKYTPGQGTATGTAGPLNQSIAVRGLRSKIEEALTTVSPDLPSQINRLGALGITPGANGQLQIDTAQLKNVLNGNVAGVGFDDLKSLFGLQGQSSSAGVQFATATAKTKSAATPYTVHVTQAAQRASVTGTAVATSTVIDDTNNSLVITLDGKTSSTITLASGTYTAQQLANEVQTEINAAMLPNGSTSSVTLDNGKLVVTSGRYGTASTISINSGTSLSALGFTGSESSTGIDVAGSFVVNGQTEVATGVGQILTGNSANANTDGLSVVVTLTPSQITPGGVDSTMKVTRGVAANVSSMLTEMLDPVNGQITQIAKQFSDQIQTAQNDVNKQTTAMNLQQATLLRQFSQMETVLANLQAESNLITSSFGTATASSMPSISSSG